MRFTPTPVFAQVTSSLSRTTPQYDISRTFSLFPRRHQLGEVLQIMKRFGQAILS